MSRTLCALALALVTASDSRAVAQILYAATGSNGVAGNLYTVDPATGVSTLVGPTGIPNFLGGFSSIGLTGLAVHPTTGVLYGVTPNLSGGLTTNLRSLVKINPATGNATLIGPMVNPVGDIAFDAGGTLYGWQAGLTTPRSLVRINLLTGVQTQTGNSGLTGTSGNGLSFVAGTLYLAANGSGGALRTVNTASGATTAGPTLSGAPQVPGAIAALAVDTSGILFGVNTNQADPAKCNLVVIDPTTGAVHDRGALPDQTDAIAFTKSGVTTPPGTYFPLTPCRVLDPRTTASSPAGGTRALTLAGGACGIAAAAKAVSLNVTATNVAATGHLTLYAADQVAPGTSTISFDAGRTRANNAIVQVATDGSGTINILNASAGLVDVVVDVNGFFQ